MNENSDEAFNLRYEEFLKTATPEKLRAIKEQFFAMGGKVEQKNGVTTHHIIFGIKKNKL